MKIANLHESKKSILPSHDGIWLLLPWYANGSLQAAEMEMVEDHLQVCPACQKDLDVQRRLPSTWWLFRIAYGKHLKANSESSRFWHLSQIDDGFIPDGKGSVQGKLKDWAPIIIGELPTNQQTLLELTYQHGLGYSEIADIVGCSEKAVKKGMFDSQKIIKPLLPKLIDALDEEYLKISSTSFSRLMSKIQGGKKAKNEASRKDRFARVADWLESLRTFMMPPRLAFGLASALLALTLPFLLQEHQVETPQLYHTVADAGSLGQFSNNDIQVVFADQVTEQQATDIIKSLQGHVVNGPTNLGVYTIRVVGGAGSENTVAGCLEKLRENKSVVFAEPALP